MTYQFLTDLAFDFPTNKASETALIFLAHDGMEEASLTFSSLAEQCRRVGENLYRKSPKREVVLLSLDHQKDFVPAFFGCILAGKIPAPLPSLRSKSNRAGWGRAAALLRSGQATALLINADQQVAIRERLSEGECSDLTFYPYEELIGLADPTTVTLPLAKADDVAYVQYTSGSTAAPKGIALTHTQVLSNMARMYRVFDRGEEVRVVGWLPFYHDMGLVGHLFTALYECGLGVFLPPAVFLAHPAHWLVAIDKYRATSAAAPTFSLAYCVQKIQEPGDWDLSSWKHAYIGSETVSLPVLDQFAQHFAGVRFDRNALQPVYGLAEVTLLAAGGGVGLNELDADILKHEVGPGIYRQLIPYRIDPEMKVIIRDPETGEPVVLGETGEVTLVASSGHAGYLNELSSLSNLKAQPVKTGDLGFLSEDLLYLTGRLPDVVIVRGVNFVAEDLEYAARSGLTELGANDATACLMLQIGEQEKLAVFQEIGRHLPTAEQARLAENMRANLSERMGLRAQILLVPKGLLPRTSSYKVARAACAKRFAKGKLPVLYTLEGEVPSQNGFSDEDPVVIVGMACRFPGGADSPDKLWTLLKDGKDAIVEIPEDRWDRELFFDEKPGMSGKMNTRWGGFIDHIDHFDPAPFHISDYEAGEIDPQQRLLLETSWRLLEHAGWKRERLAGSSTGVFIGISTNDYLSLKIKLGHGLEGFNAYSGLGISHSIAANRLSYFYDLKGPSLAVDTACSSSLTAFHLAATAIGNGECEQAIVGGVNAILAPGSTVVLSQLNMMAPDGRCKAFSAKADGYVRSEGCGLVLLKRRSAAERDGDHILATLRASATGQDGHSTGITHPDGPAQERLLRQTLAKSGLKAEDITYVEAHGTGTRSGDPVEWEQLRRVYGKLSSGKAACCVGSIKANIGHLEAAAGIAGVIKGVLMLQNRQIPPQLYLTDINPKLRLDATRLQLTAEGLEWKVDEGITRKLAISSFGFGGSLAHVILEENLNTRVPTIPEPDFGYYPFVFSATTPTALAAQAAGWADWLGYEKTLTLQVVAQTMARCRMDLPYRASVPANNLKDLSQKLSGFQTESTTSKSRIEARKLCFLFTGQGQHYQYAGKRFYQRFSAFRRHFDRCASALDKTEYPEDLAEIAFFGTGHEQNDDRYQHPIAFALQYALGRFCQDLRLRPAVLLGYSFGEYAAACLAGCFRPEDGMRMIAKRAQLAESLSGQGLMATIYADAATVENVMDPQKASVAVYHSPHKAVISGDAYEVVRVCQLFNEKGIKHYNLKTNRAYHSHLLDPIKKDFAHFLRTITFREPTLPWLSSLTGEWQTEAPGPDYWIRQLREPVHFNRACTTLLGGEQAYHFMEIGPGASALMAVNENSEDKDALLLRSMIKAHNVRHEDHYFMDGLGKLYQKGFPVDWTSFLEGSIEPTRLPGYFFQRRKFRAAGLEAEDISRSLAGDLISRSNGHVATSLAPAAAPKDAANSQKNRLRYATRWIGTDGVAEKGEAIETRVHWCLLGPNTRAIRVLRAQLKQDKAVVTWFGPAQVNGPRPDVTLPKNPSKEVLEDQLHRLINLQARQDVEVFRLLFVAGEPTPAEGLTETALSSASRNGIGVFNALLRALRGEVKRIDLWLVTTGAVAVDELEMRNQDLAQSSIWGYAKTAFLEHPGWRGGMIDLGSGQLAPVTIEHLLAKLCRPGEERCVALRERRAYLEELYPLYTTPTTKQPNLRNDGVYLVTGGLGGLGLKTANWLAERGADHIVLTGRRSLPEREIWGELAETNPQFGLVQSLLSLQNQVKRLDILCQDIRDTDALTNWHHGLQNEGIPLRGVVHAAGVNWFAKISEMGRDEMLDTLKIKVEAAWALHQLTKEADLDIFALYSSVSSLWGSVNLSHYTAANAFLDALAGYRQAIGLPALAINWGPWAEVGMSAPAEVGRVLEQLGFERIAPATALEELGRALADGEAQRTIAEIDWSKFRPFIDYSLRPSLFRLVAGEMTVIGAASQDLQQILSTSPPTEARSMIETRVRSILRSVMLMESMDAIDDQQRFNFLGMDSLMGIAFVVELEQFFQLKIPNTLPYNYPHIRAVSDYIYTELFGELPLGGEEEPLVMP